MKITLPINPINPFKPIIMGFVLLLAACGGPQQQTSTTDTVTDDYGRTVVVPAHPQRVVSLSPAVTEIIFALGAENLLGWFTGGQAGTTQHLKVGGAILQFNATGKTSGVDGALVLEFELGSANTTSTAAMLKIAGTLKVNAGSSIVVDAGGKGAGTYKLVQAGTLTDNANLPANATVTNCKSGYYGTVVRSGNNLNLVIAAGTPPSTDIAITASAAYVTYPSPKFTVSGTVAVGEGTTTATLHYMLGGGTEQTLALALGADGSFSADIPYASAGDTLVWRVIAENVNGGATATGATASTTTARAADSAATTYVWTGAAGDGKWTTGDYDLQRQGEETFYYPGAFLLRALWDVSQAWNPTATPLPRQKPGAITKQKPDKEKQVKNRNAERQSKKKK